MSKRGADEYITKENGSTLNTPSENSKVKMATAAQLAKRKMAVPKSRAGRTGQSPLPGSGLSSPFSSMAGASQNNNQPQTFGNTGGVAFGASQSFPAGNSAPATSNGFNFQIPGQSSSFTFGQPVPNNPFATSNGNANNQPSQNQETSDITMESPQKKPAFSSGLFGSNDANNTQSTGFTFGQTAAQSPSKPTFSFGQSSGFGSTSGTSATSGTTLFGQSASKPSESSSPNPFGQPAQSQPSTSNDKPVSFGQTPTAPPQQPSSSGFTFGQPTTSAPASAPSFSFGQSTTSAPSAASGFSFGNITAESTGTSPLFAGSAQSSMPTFGSSVASSQPATSMPSFGSTPTANSNNAFSGFGSPKPTDSIAKTESTTLQDQPKQPLFGQSTSASQDQTKSAETTQDPPKVLNPFAGLFAPSTSSQSATSTPAAEASKPLFNFAAPSQPSGLFSAPKSTGAESTPKASEEVKKPTFSFGTPSTAPSTGLFSPSKPSTEPSKGANPFSGLSGGKTASTIEQAQSQPLFGNGKDTAKTADAGFKPLPAFGNPSVNSVSPSAQSTPKSFGGFGKTQPTASDSPLKPVGENKDLQTQSKMPAFGASTIMKPNDTAASNTDLFTATAKAAATATPSRSSTAVSSTSDDPKRSVNTYPPTRIPPYLNGDDYKSYDSNYRLHSLNRELQKRVASLDPSRQDFENLIRNYVAARESIGESIGLYTRNVAGMKRKSDEDDTQDNDSSSAKRTKPDNTTTSNALSISKPITNTAVQPASSTSSSFKPTITSANNPSNFGSALFASSTPSVPPASNPFANLANTSTAASNEPSAKPAFSFGSSIGTSAPVGSTTPTKSPPKKPTFEMPKFAAPAGGTNFMDAFRKQSEASAVKFAKDAKAKRKAEDFDSDEDDEEEWNKKYEEEEKAKKAKVEAVAAKGFTPIFGNGTSSDKPAFSFGNANANSTASKPASGFLFGNKSTGKSSDKPIDISDNDTSGNDEEAEDEEGSGTADEGDQDEEEEEAQEDDLPEDEIEADDEDEEEDDDLETIMARSRNQGKSLFERVSANPNLSKDTDSTTNARVVEDAPKKPSTFGNVFGKNTSDTPSSSSLMSSAAKEPYVPSKTFNFTPMPPVTSSTPVPGASIFAGGTMRDGPITGEGLFGSRPSTPSNSEKPKANIFGNLGTPSTNSGTDNTWKKGSEIKFGGAEAPAVSITAPTPRKDESKPFANLFGATSSAGSSASNPSLGFGFGQSPAPGFLAAASHLAGGSGTNSGFSSRATSPGTTDNESVATNEEDYSNDTQVSLMETRPGEENENVVFEIRARALRFYNAKQIEGTKLIEGWNSVGLGIARLLKHKDTGKTRLVMRAEPGANIILNTNLQPELKYEFAPQGNAGAVKFQVVTNEGPQGWILKVKTHQMGQDLAKSLEENKKPST